MKYVGSKRRLAKHILPIILKGRKPGQWYVEPFCGGCNTLSLVEGNRIGADAHYYLIALWQAVSEGWGPPVEMDEFTESMYQEMKRHKNQFPAYLVGYVGFAYSFAAKFFGGWRRNKQGDHKEVLGGNRSARKQFPKLHHVKFFHCSYEELPLPDQSLIYCDPPYAGTQGYQGTGKLDYEKFWQWCRDKKEEGHTIFVSEYEAPKDFTVVFEKELYNTLDKDTGAKRGIERLFTL